MCVCFWLSVQFKKLNRPFQFHTNKFNNTLAEILYEFYHMKFNRPQGRNPMSQTLFQNGTFGLLSFVCTIKAKFISGIHKLCTRYTTIFLNSPKQPQKTWLESVERAFEKLMHIFYFRTRWYAGIKTKQSLVDLFPKKKKRILFFFFWRWKFFLEVQRQFFFLKIKTI